MVMSAGEKERLEMCVRGVTSLHQNKLERSRAVP